MSHIRTNATELLKENLQQTLRRYPSRICRIYSEQRSGLFSWLFNEELAQDFDTSLTDAQKAEYNTFLATL